ncbi:hypothetical protein [Leptospira biflexa]|nr:hypothetical protein [Leptospira biflexa]
MKFFCQIDKTLSHSFILLFILFSQLHCLFIPIPKEGEKINTTIDFHVGQKVYINVPLGFILRESPKENSHAIKYLQFGVPFSIKNILTKEEIFEGKYIGYWMEGEKGGWIFSHFVTQNPNESNLRATFNRLLSEFEEYKSYDETLTGKESFKRKSLYGFWSKVCKPIESSDSR